MSKSVPENAEQMNLRLSTALLAALDNVRRVEPDLPSRQEMIRRLIQRAEAEIQRKTAH
jgi:metal-responsive CopG/Arc/MetJ family transcriptional regulator